MGRPTIQIIDEGPLSPDSISSAGDSCEVDDANSIIRGKWCLDGCRSLAEVADRLRRAAAEYEQMRDAGWELTHPIEDDYGFVRQTQRAAA